ncbi:MAG: Lrp/AsnC family transcriptional regulator [Halobacteriota archaeon]|nr:Lrp/AsnC family transcriptional regulator [Halobacteriota archaeon]
MTAKIDELDQKILETMMGGYGVGAKMTELASGLSESRSTINLRVSKLQEKGVISGYKPDIDWSKLGYDLLAYVGTVCPDEFVGDLVNVLKDEDTVYEVWEVMTGTFDILMKCRFKDYSEISKLHDLIMSVSGIREVDIWLLGPCRKCK